MSDPTLRNLWITRRYHELAVQLRDVGLGDEATWCAFAVWASKTAGKTIRGDELPARVRVLLNQSGTTGGVIRRFNSGLQGCLLAQLEHVHLLNVVKEVSNDVSAQIAEGNCLVFAELAPLFTLLVDGWTAAPPDDPAALQARLAPELSALAAKGIDTAALETAFTRYALAQGNAADRASLVLAANILAVSHEQERLQPYIAEALDAAVTVTLKALITDKITRHIPTKQARQLFNVLVDDVCGVLDRAFQTALTELMLQLITSDEILDLRRNVPLLAGVMYPAGLATLVGTSAEVPFTQWDTTGGTGIPTGADDWAEMVERMNYIVTLFRSRQSHPPLFSPPFSPAQLVALDAGQLPAEPL